MRNIMQLEGFIKVKNEKELANMPINSCVYYRKCNYVKLTRGLVYVYTSGPFKGRYLNLEWCNETFGGFYNGTTL